MLDGLLEGWTGVVFIVLYFWVGKSGKSPDKKKSW